MLPASGWLGIYPMTSVVGNVLPLPLPVAQIEQYADGAEVEEIVEPEDEDLGWPSIIHVGGAFSTVIVAGRDDAGAFGFHIDITRGATYGTVLIDRVEFNTAVIDLRFDNCPDTSIFSASDSGIDVIPITESNITPIFISESGV